MEPFDLHGLISFVSPAQIELVHELYVSRVGIVSANSLSKKAFVMSIDVLEAGRA